MGCICKLVVMKSTPVRSLLILIVLVLNVLSVSGQSEDSLIKEVRWIRITIDSIDSAVLNSMFTDIDSLVNQDSLVFFLENRDITYKRKHYIHTLKNMVRDSLPKRDWLRYYDYEGDSTSYLVVLDGYYPFYNHKGESQTSLNKQYGYESYIYPIPKGYYEIVPNEVVEIRIREVKCWNTKKETFEFKTEALRLYPIYGMIGSEELWIDLNEVSQVLGDKLWLQYFFNQDYHGYQFMQTNQAKYH